MLKMEITVHEISERLNRDVERVCQMLLPGGKPMKGEWVAGDVSGSPGDSLKVNLTGPHIGKWTDWADQSQRGDLLDLWRLARGLQPAEAIRQAKQWLGISDGVGAVAPRKYSEAKDDQKITALNPGGRACEYLTKKRGLDPATVNRFKVQGDGRNLVFACYSPVGNLVNRSYRTLGEKKEVWQDKGCAPCLFGWHALPESAYSSRTVLLCEGQIDAMTWAQWGVPALSIPNGSGQTWIEFEWENLAAFDHIYISFDMDGAGAENADRAIQRLGKHRCMIVVIPGKDANDCLQTGYSDAEARKWVEQAKPPQIKGLVLAHQLEQRLRQALRPRPDCFTLPFLRNGSAGHGYFPRPAEVTVWTGVTGQGKSTFLDYFVISALVCGHPVLLASMERKAEQSLARMMTSFFGKAPQEEDIETFMAEVGHSLIFSDVVGYIGQEQLLEQMQFAQRRYGIEHCVIDSLMRIDGLEEEFVQQGKFLNLLQEFAKNTGVHVHIVCHPRKMAEDGKPGKMDVKGSSLIPNNADNIVAVCRNMEKERLRKDGQLTPMQNAMMYDAEIRVEKQRETGWEGRFLLKFDPVNFTYGPFKLPEAKPDPRNHSDQ